MVTIRFSFLIFIFCSVNAAGQLHSNLQRLYYSPNPYPFRLLSYSYSPIFSSLTLKRIPKSIKEEVLFMVNKKNNGLDTNKIKQIIIVEYGKDSQVVAKQLINNKIISQTDFIFKGGFYGLSIRRFKFVNSRKVLYEEMKSIKLSTWNYISVLQYPYHPNKFKLSPNLVDLASYTYLVDSVKEIVTERCLLDLSNGEKGIIKDEVIEYDFNGNVLRYSQFSDSTFANYYYPLPTIYKSKNPPFSLPDSVIEYKQFRGQVFFTATIYIRNKYKDPIQILSYSSELGLPRILALEVNNIYKYDSYGNWTRLQMVRKYVNEKLDFNEKCILIRNFIY